MDYKLTYFNLRVLGEPIRWIFAVADQPFQDDRIEVADWPAKKGTFLWGQVPVLSFDGGKTMSQSVAISEFLARRFKLVPNDEEQKSRCLELVLHIQDCRTKWVPFYMEADPVKREAIRKDLMENVFTHFLAKFNDIVAANGETHVVGPKTTWADLWLANFTEIWRNTIDPTLLSKYPALQKQLDTVLEIPQIKSWVKKRPNGDLLGLVM